MKNLSKFVASAALLSSVAFGGALPAQAQVMSFNETDCWSQSEESPDELSHFPCSIALYDTGDGIRVVRWQSGDGKFADHAFFFSKTTRKPLHVEIRFQDGTSGTRNFYVDSDGDYRVQNTSDEDMLAIRPPSNPRVVTISSVRWRSGQTAKSGLLPSASGPRPTSTLRQLFD